MRRPTTFAAALLLAAATPALAQGPPAAQAAQEVRGSAADLQAAFFALQDEFDDAFQAFRQELGELGRRQRENPDQKLERPESPQAAFYPRFAALADQGSVDAQLWLVQNHTVSGLQGEAAAADKRARLLKVLASSPTNEQLGLLPRILSADAAGRGSLSKEEGMAFLELVCASATDPEVQSSAAFYKASAQDVRGGSRADRAPAMAAYKTVEARWPGTQWGKRAGGQAFAFENLNIGQKAPEIAGQDVDGNAMKLSDFAGRVVVLDFWGFW